ncbi:anaphase-promoting complex, cyclosome, subunit 4-domain-containing protein [Lipomyces orientalis]|uniref:Anaphase-promoting complex, cyclosome, subunit 4-domain-containing protein n=1 Tax=Lipomyces orientalis TaxID=1233043 RepID=A0ACC3TMK2_9ASCO
MSNDGYGSKAPSSFRILSEKTLQGPAQVDLFTWCPRMDLLTFSPDPASIWLYRMSGQLVWKMSLKDSKTAISALAWRPDGKMLALGCSDGMIRVCDVNNGRIVHQIATRSSISCVNWVAEDNSSIQSRNSAPFDNILNIDITANLPKLSALPTAFAPDSIFASKVVLDSMINSSFMSEESSMIDILVNGERDNRIFFNIFGHFSIANIACPSPLEKLTPLCHASSPDLSFHAFIAESQDHALFMLPLRVHFIRRFGNDLAHISSASTKVQALLIYISDVMGAVAAEWKNMESSLVRPMKSLEATLVTEKDSDVVLSLLETLILGIPTDAIKTWITNYLSDRAVRSWRKASSSAYENIRKLLLENLIPACERVVVLITRVRGLARWRERGVHLGLNPDSYTHIVDALTLIMGKAHRLIWDLNKEYDHFKPFIQWIKFILDDVTNHNATAEDPDSPIETAKVATYITDYLNNSTMANYFSGDISSTNLNDLVVNLKELCENAFRESSESMKNHVVFGSPLRLADNVAIKELCMSSRVIQRGSESFMYTALSLTANADCVSVICLDLSGNYAELSSCMVRSASFAIGNEAIKALEFVDDEKLMLLVHPVDPARSKIKARIVSLEFERLLAESAVIVDAREFNGPICSVQHSTDLSEPAWSQCREFTDDFLPIALAVNGRKGRRVGSVIADDRHRFLVFDLDDDEAADEEESDNDTMIE